MSRLLSSLSILSFSYLFLFFFLMLSLIFFLFIFIQFLFCFSSFVSFHLSPSLSFYSFPYSFLSFFLMLSFISFSLLSFNPFFNFFFRSYAFIYLLPVSFNLFFIHFHSYAFFYLRFLFIHPLFRFSSSLLCLCSRPSLCLQSVFRFSSFYAFVYVLVFHFIRSILFFLMSPFISFSFTLCSSSSLPFPLLLQSFTRYPDHLLFSNPQLLQSLVSFFFCPRMIQ
ncbi:unnamed protein product [Acanthosepion pharaonis]|uniref:Uncharacterized protein n=1 Tax=Acanthosepion pharaonis TaxID=158019 RepID=A0A812AZ07_ACAPH|nr:unnamed protein product [Sepia pharaonis]